jgi:hypothetical protein
MLWNAVTQEYTVSTIEIVCSLSSAYNFLVPIPHDPHPGRFVRHLDFNHFRTIGMRRSVEEGVNSRFVTGDRIRAVLKVSYSFDISFLNG